MGYVTVIDPSGNPVATGSAVQTHQEPRNSHASSKDRMDPLYTEYLYADEGTTC